MEEIPKKVLSPLYGSQDLNEGCPDFRLNDPPSFKNGHYRSPVTLSHISKLITIKTKASPEMAFEFMGADVGGGHIKLPFKTN